VTAGTVAAVIGAGLSSLVGHVIETDMRKKK
jgi:hypothetical protein